jgi:transaldolase
MPEPVIHAFADHGETADTIRPNYELAHRDMTQLADAGIDLDDVYDTLEREGVEKFEASWNELLAGVQASLDAARKGATEPNKAAAPHADAAEKKTGK